MDARKLEALLPIRETSRSCSNGLRRVNTVDVSCLEGDLQKPTMTRDERILQIWVTTFSWSDSRFPPSFHYQLGSPFEYALQPYQ